MMLPTLFACRPCGKQMLPFLNASAAFWTLSMNASRKIDILKVNFPFVLFPLCFVQHNNVCFACLQKKKKSFNVTSSFLLRQRTRVFNKFSSVFRFFMHTKYSLAMFFCSIPQPPREIANKYLQRSFLRHDPRQMNAFSLVFVFGAERRRLRESENPRRDFPRKSSKSASLSLWGWRWECVSKYPLCWSPTQLPRLTVCGSQFSQFFISFTNFSFMIEFFFSQAAFSWRWHEASTSEIRKAVRSVCESPAMYWRFRFFYVRSALA